MSDFHQGLGCNGQSVRGSDASRLARNNMTNPGREGALNTHY